MAHATNPSARRASDATKRLIPGVTERVRSPCVDHLLGFWVPIEIRGRSLVRWKALVKAYMPVRNFFFEKIFLEENFI